MKTFHALAIVLFVSAQSSALAADKPQALVYKGPGACPEQCSEAAARMAQLAGFEARFVGPEETDLKIFDRAAIWIQPGGKSRQVSKSMNPELKQGIRNFVASGGGYVGFCAGGFFATALISDTKIEGLGILPGENALYPEPKDAVMLPMRWMTGGQWKDRLVYWEGGPYFKPGPNDAVEVTATYPDGQVANLRAQYGLGRVNVTGMHPEAPDFWKTAYRLEDPSGNEWDLAVEMIGWATRKSD